MKTPQLRGYKWLLAVTSMTALFGCLDEKQRINAQSSNVAPAAVGPAETLQTVASEQSAEAPVVIPSVSPAIAELAKLAQASVSEEVLLAYIKKHARPFNPTADEILYLNDLGVSDAVITALVDYKPAAELAEQPVTSLATSPQPAPTVVTNVIVNTIPETRFGGEVATSQPPAVPGHGGELGGQLHLDGYKTRGWLH